MFAFACFCLLCACLLLAFAPFCLLSLEFDCFCSSHEKYSDEATHERACCEPTHIGKWDGVWEQCVLIQGDDNDNSETSNGNASDKSMTCNVRSLVSGKEYFNFPKRLVRSILGKDNTDSGFECEKAGKSIRRVNV